MNMPIRKDPPKLNGLRDEYEFDYAQAKQNRFAVHMKQPVVAVVLEADVASRWRRRTCCQQCCRCGARLITNDLLETAAV